MVKRRTYGLILLLLMSSLCVRAQFVGAGSSSFTFLSLPASARLNALGGTNVSVRDGDVSMAMCNPALLGAMTDKTLQLNFAYLMPGTMFGSAIYGHNFGRSKVEKPYAGEGEPDKPNYFAVGIHYLDYGKMTYADDWGNTYGTFTAKDIVINAVYARQLSEHFTIGTTLKPIISVYERYSSFALGADVGAHFQMRDTSLQVGLSLQNIGYQLRGFYSKEGGRKLEMLPLNLQLGLSYRFSHAPIRLSMTIHNMQRWNLNYAYTNVPVDPYTGEALNTKVQWYDMMFRHTIFAIDIVPKSNRFYLTLSYNHRRRAEMALADQRSLAGFAIGGGLNIYKFRVNFTFSQLTKSNYTYQVGLSLDINSMMK
ncbi:MAG: type IX secretion system protein PorQ [Paludibacteraceae bacterium]|nr:type IX secretion system protein PorQ [Paludibacteraceae bacterium]